MDLAVFLFVGFFALIAIVSVAFVGLSFYVGWTGYTHKDRDENYPL
jgi:hypothetical protein